MNGYEVVIDELALKQIEATYQTERVEPYVNVGDVKHVKNRMQFWMSQKTDEVHAFVGKEMGAWYLKEIKSPYLVTDYRYSDKECKITFPSLTQAVEFIRSL